MVRFGWTVTVSFVLVLCTREGADAKEAWPFNAKRVLFIGDSITAAGHYVATLEAQLRIALRSAAPEVINLGLPSETCSGLSEPDHPFPRPDVHERLDRALTKVKPDLVVACYGMNDGIYYPFSLERFEAYQKGIQKLIDQVHDIGAKLILMTPPAFDPLPLKKQGKLLPRGAEKYAWFAIYENYDQEVLRRYAGWIMEQRGQVEMVIDLHSAVSKYVSEKRKQDADFTMSPDGVHVNREGHAVLADAIWRAWGHEQLVELKSESIKLVEERQTILHAAWLSHVGHQRPGMEPGLPLAEAQRKAADMERNINEWLTP